MSITITPLATALDVLKVELAVKAHFRPFVPIPREMFEEQ